MGRKTIYTPETGREICARISKGETLTSICKDAKMPMSRTVSDWRAVWPEFSADFARARETGFDALADECLKIADTPIEGVETTTKPDGTIETKQGDMLQHRKLQIETRLKLLAKWDYKRYGEKVGMDVSGNLSLTGLLEEAENRRKAGKTP